MFESDCVVKGVKSQVNEDVMSHNNSANSEKTFAACENSKLRFSEEIKQMQERKYAVSKPIEENTSFFSGGCNDQINVLKTVHGKGSSEANLEKRSENYKEDKTNQRINSTKITFYCENVDKLMCDLVGEEYDEPIQEVTQTVDNSV